MGILSNNLYVAQVDLTPLGINLKDGAVHQSRIAFDGTGLIGLAGWGEALYQRSRFREWRRR